MTLIKLITTFFSFHCLRG